MKYSRLVKYLRIALAITLLAAGAAIAIVANRPEHKQNFARFRGDPDGDLENNSVARAGSEEGGPYAKALEDAALRAYPAEDLPFAATQNAIASWQELQARFDSAMAVNPANPFLNWKMIGPSFAPFPPPLTFSGAAYVTSGRITALALAPGCNATACRLWVAAAGGGIWRTDNALANSPSWTFVSQVFATNAIGSLTYHAASNTLYAGTGEPNASADSEAGLGVYKSTDGGTTWTLLPAVVTGITSTSPAGGGTFSANGTYTGNAFAGRAVSAVVVDPTNANHLYVGSVRAVRGVSSTGAGATSNPPPPRPPFGLWESTDGGATFKFIWDGGDQCPATCDGSTPKASVRGTTDVELDPGWNGTSNKILYANAFGLNGVVTGAGGVWRSNDGGATWTQIKAARNSAAGDNSDRCEFSVTALAGGKTRMYVGAGNGSTTAANAAHVYRTDDAVAATGDASFTDLTALQEASPAKNQSLGYCQYSGGAQCWYDNVIYSPPGKPDVLYVGGSYDYDQYGVRNNGRAFLRSTDAGVTFNDVTWDATTGPTPNPTCCQNNAIAPNGMHPDSHFVIEVPGTNITIFGSDGGLVRSSGTFTDISAQCDNLSRNFGAPLSAGDLATCKQLLKSVPTLLISMNNALSTLQFQHLSVAANNSTLLQGGTQDNGTFQTNNSQTWPQIYYGDGGFSGFSSTNSNLRFASNTGRSMVANFQNGDPTKWVLIYNGIETSALFYAPNIADPSPAAAQTIFHGGTSVWRTQDWGGPQAVLEANCNIYTAVTLTGCGDFVAIGPAGNTSLTASVADYRGTTRSGGNVSFLARTGTDAVTLWAATSGGRLFVSKNANAAAPAVTWVRVDSLDAASPTRAITGIYVDPANPNHAWVSYNGYAFNTPTTPGHVYSVVFNPAGPTATFTNIDSTGAGAFPDFPATAVAAAPNGDVYAANDFGVLRLPSGTTTWEISGFNMPMVEVSALTVSADGAKLFAATHGRSAWAADLPFGTRATGSLTTQAIPTSGNLGTSVKDSATLTGGISPTGTITFQLYGPNDATCSGGTIFTSTVSIADNGTYESASYTPTQPGTYRWTALYSGDASNSAIQTPCNDPNETVTIGATAQFLNMSTRMRTDATTNNGNSVGIGGFTITGAVPKHVLVRAIGPSLTKFGFAATDVIADPVLELHGPGAFGTITNNNWRDSQEALIKQDGLAPTNDLESAIDATLPPGQYTAIIKGNTGTAQAGLCLFEVYDLDTAATSKLANLSTRAFVGTGNNVVIAGFVLGKSQGSDRVAVRGLGPSLASFGIANTLADPTLELRDENGTLILANNDWQDNAGQAALITAAGLAPSNTKEAALTATLPPGLYTAILAGANSGTGVGNVEVYDLGP